MLRNIVSYVICVAFALSVAAVPYADPDQDMVSQLGLSLEAQIAQMCQIDVWNFMLGASNVLNATALAPYLAANKVGSLLNSPSSQTGSVPTIDEWRTMQQAIYNLSTSIGNKVPILYGLDSVHGANYIFNATLFPQQIGVAATFNGTHAFMGGLVTGRETRYAGIPWAFAPILGVAVQPSWARVYETFGEDPLLVSTMGENIVKGLQAPVGSFSHAVAACLKHYIGYPNPRTGHDRTPSWIPMNHLLQYFAPSFQRAINAGALSVMENYVEVNGRPTVGSNLLLQFLLRDVMGFEGMMVTDYNEIYNLMDFHATALSYSEATKIAIGETSIDMGMMGDVSTLLADLLANLTTTGQLPATRIKESANRVLNLKRRLGLFNGTPVPPRQEDSGLCMFGCPEHRQAALQAVRDSLTLLQNTGNILPMPSALGGGSKIAVVGQACDSPGLMAGGWTIHWQGTSNASAFPYATTIRQELVKRYPTANVVYAAGCSVLEGATCSAATLAEAVEAATNASYVVVCLGERHYAEKPGDIIDATLPGKQIEMVAQIAAANANIIAVLIEGRPRLLGSVPSNARAVLHAYLPGPFGGQAVAEALMGIVIPNGKLPLTYPSTINNAPIQYWRKYSANHADLGPYPDYGVQWTFGYGLSYTTFAYSGLLADINFETATVDVSVDVRNTGAYDAKEVVMAFSTQIGRPISPEVQMLRAFQKVIIRAGQEMMVFLSIPLDAFAYYDEFNCKQLDTMHDVTITVADQSATVPAFPVVYLRNCTQWATRAMQAAGMPTAPQAAPNAVEPSIPTGTAIGCVAGGAIGALLLAEVIRRVLPGRRSVRRTEEQLLQDGK